MPSKAAARLMLCSVTSTAAQGFVASVERVEHDRICTNNLRTRGPSRFPLLRKPCSATY